MTRDIELKILDARLGAEFPLPDYATALSAGMDLRAMLDAPMTLTPGEAAYLAALPKAPETLTVRA